MFDPPTDPLEWHVENVPDIVGSLAILLSDTHDVAC